MYNKSFKRAGSSSRGGSFRGGNRGGFSRGGRSSSSGRRGFSGQRIDVSRFICRVDKVEEARPYEAKHTFADFSIDERLKRNVLAKGYLNPMPIQDQAIPKVLEGLDVVGIANTGTGKTAAFLVPLLNKVFLNKNENVMVVVPTRELAIQINQELMQFAAGLRIFSVCVVGGAPIYRQVSDLRRSHNFVIGTPGRLKDLIERGNLQPARFQTIVLDEADRMLDMGFIRDMRFIMDKMPAKRQTLFFSATLAGEVSSLIREFLHEPVTISVKTGDTSKNVDQDVVRVKSGDSKVDILHDLLNKEEFNKVLIFGQTKHGVERLSIELSGRGFRAESIHGDKNLSKRQRALRAFKENEVQILVATDVAARGLDIPNVSHVINFDLPNTYEDYVHRIGRTGRGGQKGKALTFVGH